MSRVLTLPKVDRNDPMPRYLQVREILVEAIRSGLLLPGQKLPSTKEISSLVDISLITAHKALEGLVDSGWLRREVGRGTYVRDDLDPAEGAQRRMYVGLLLDQHVNIDDYYHSTIINGLRQEARKNGQRVEFFFHDHFDLRDKGGKDVGAICIHPTLGSQADVEHLAQRHPVVVLGGTFPENRVAAVDCDNAYGARAAVRHLCGLGHRRFMVLSGPMSLSNARDRAAGAQAQLAEYEIELAPRDCPVSRDSVVLDAATREQVETSLTAPDRPTAIVAGGFYLALAAIQTARHVGLRVPEDVSIVGFDDPPSAPLLDPPLTTVRQPLDEMAACAYRWLRQAIQEGGGEPRLTTLPTELLIRDSTRSV